MREPGGLFGSINQRIGTLFQTARESSIERARTVTEAVVAIVTVTELELEIKIK